MSFFINLVPYNSYFNLLSNWYHILQCSTFGLLSHTLNLIIVFSLFNVVLLFLILSLLFSCVSYTLQKLYMSPFIFCVRACGRWELDYLRIRISWYGFHIVLQGQGFSVMVGICRQGGDAKNSMYGWCIFYLYRFPTYIYSTLTLQPLWYHIFQSSTFGLLSHALFFLRLIYIIVFSLFNMVLPFLFSLSCFCVFRIHCRSCACHLLSLAFMLVGVGNWTICAFASFWYDFHIFFQGSFGKGQGYSCYIMVGICRQGGDAKKSMYGWCIFYVYRFPTYIFIFNSYFVVSLVPHLQLACLAYCFTCYSSCA